MSSPQVSAVSAAAGVFTESLCAKIGRTPVKCSALESQLLLFVVLWWCVPVCNNQFDSLAYRTSNQRGLWSNTWTCSLKGESDLICSLFCFWRFAFQGPWLRSCDRCICSPRTAASLWYTSITWAYKKYFTRLKVEENASAVPHCSYFYPPHM